MNLNDNERGDFLASATVKMPDEFLLKVSRLGSKTDEIVERVLEVGGEIALKKVKSNLQTAIGKNTQHPSGSTGELVSSLGLSPVKPDKNDNHDIKIGFNEPRRAQRAAKGKRSYYVSTNAMIANVLEYGRHNQPPRPFLKPAKSASRKQCIEAMKAKLEEEIEKI